MFTGIIEQKAEIVSLEGNVLTISRPASFTDLEIGASICVSGVCLTVVSYTEEKMTFEVVDETLRASRLGYVQRGDVVNLERSLKADGRLEGHVVQGHVEGVGTVFSTQSYNENDDQHSTFNIQHSSPSLAITLPNTALQFVVPKGSIAIDGVSLTVASVKGNRCTVALVPHTVKHTTLGTVQDGDLVNIETDIVVRSLSSLVAVHA